MNKKPQAAQNVRQQGRSRRKHRKRTLWGTL